MNVATTKVLQFIDDHPQCVMEQLMQQEQLPMKICRQTMRVLNHRKLIRVDTQKRFTITPEGYAYLSDRLKQCKTKEITSTQRHVRK